MAETTTHQADTNTESRNEETRNVPQAQRGASRPRQREGGGARPGAGQSEQGAEAQGKRGRREPRTRERGRRQRKPRERTRPEFDQKIVAIRRVTRVVAGGRRFSFSVSLVAGNRRGQVGVGLGKAADTAQAIDKALKDAKKNLITVNLTKDKSIPHETQGKFASSFVIMMPAPGKGLRAGASVRTVLEHAGVRDVSAKILTRSKSQLNNARAAIEALKKLG